jgi:ActR/RegA family two-component response regulator
MKSLLLIEDDPIMGESLMQRFQLEGYEVAWARRLGEADAAREASWDAIVCDVRMPDGLATEWFADLATRVRALPWFFLTGYGSVNDAVAAIRAGAREYLTKPFDIERLVSLIEAAVPAGEAENDGAVLGVSPAMRRVEAMARKVARQRVSVLLTGESGVGKEVAAQLVHSIDPRSAQGEFIAVNCAAVPETMLEAEFFGYEKGAFSGAQRQHRGFLERANGGTLFLDEVGELPPSMHLPARFGEDNAQRLSRHRRNESRPLRCDVRRCIPRRSVLSPRGHPHHIACVARAPRGHPLAHRAHARADGGRPGPPAGGVGGFHARPPEPPLARQRARASLASRANSDHE